MAPNYDFPIDTPQWGLADPRPVQQPAIQSRDLPIQPVQRDIARSNNNYNPTGTYQYGQQTGIMPPINHAQPFTNLTHMVSPYTGQVFNLTGYPSKYPHMIFGDLFDTTAPYMTALIPFIQLGMQQAMQAQPKTGGDTGSSKTTDTKSTDTTKKTPATLPVPLASTRNPVTVPVTQAPQLAPSHTPTMQTIPSHTTTVVPDASRFSGPTVVSHHNGTTVGGVPTGPSQAGRMLITPPQQTQAPVAIDPSTTGLLEAAGITTPGSLLEAAGVAATPAQTPIPMASSRQRMITPPATGATTRRTTAPTASNARTREPQSLVEAAGVSNTTPEGVYLLGNGQGMTRDGNVVIVQQDALTGQYQYFDLSGNPIAIF